MYIHIEITMSHMFPARQSTYTYIYIHIYVYMYMYIYTHIYESMHIYNRNKDTCTNYIEPHVSSAPIYVNLCIELKFIQIIDENK